MTLALEIKGLQAWYGESHILHDMNLSVAPGEVVTLLGRNGAGRTTTLRAILGLTGHREGSVKINGVESIAMPTHRIAHLGVGYCPEERAIFSSLSAEENLMLPPTLMPGGMSVDAIYQMFPNLAERRHSQGTRLSGGEQQMCAIGRGIMSKPKLLIIDELSLGLAPRAVELLSESLQEINKEGLAILIVEQDVYTALDLSQFGYVIETGRVAFSGPSAELIHNQEIKKAYLGI